VSAHLPTRIAPRTRARCARAFFANFWSLLVLAVSLAEWAVVWWLYPRAFAPLPPAAHLIGAAVIYGVNRHLAIRAQRLRRRRAPTGTVLRLYYAAAFTSLFCAVFLVAAGAVWISAKLFLDVLTAEAWTAQAGVRAESTLDTGFRWLANTGMAVIGLSFIYGYTIGQRQLRVRHLRLALRNYPPSLAGLRIAQISDIHIGQNLDRYQLQRFVARVNALTPDLLCITGDIVDAPSADLEGYLPILGGLQATHGVFVILGNHDHYSDPDRVEEGLRRLTAFTVLRDACTTVGINGHPLHIIGLDDHGRDWARGKKQVSYLADALSEIASHEAMLLLCHRPDVFPQAAAGGVALTLAGHTHGGQIGIPWFKGRVRNLAEFITTFDRGLFERNGHYLYVNCGLGLTGQRIRLSTPREITIIEVAHSAVEPAAA
jgi:uncharacterized protein